MMRLRVPTWVLSLLVGMAGELPAASREVPEDLPSRYKTWAEEVDLLLTDGEWEAFLKLEKDYQRDGFIARFWRARDPIVRTERNELKDTWEERLVLARERFGSLDDARSRILLLNGEPVQVLDKPCHTFFRPVEMWYYGQQVPDPVVLIFVEPERDGLWELWDPAEGVFELIREPDYELWERCGDRPGLLGRTRTRIPQFQEAEYRCLFEQLQDRCTFDWEPIAAYLGLIGRMEAPDFSLLRQRFEARPEERDGEWLDTFASYSTDLPEGAAALSARVEILFPGRRSARTIVQGVVTVPASEARAVELAGRRSFDFQLTGEVLRREELFESFRYRFDMPAATQGGYEYPGDAVPLVFQRFLRPGTYKLILKVEDLHGRRYFRHVSTVDVPELEGAPPPPPADPATAPLMEEAVRAMTGAEPALRILAPTEGVQVGMVRFDTRVVGGEFAKVVFFLDGEEVLAKTRPPYSVELDLGRVPRVRTVRVVGYGAGGEEVARDEVEVNTGRNRFGVRLVEPRPGKTYDRSLLARATVDVPDGSRLDRVELFLNEDRLATLFQPPFEQTILLDGSRELAYVRARAYLSDGNATEDVVFVNAPDYLEQLDIQLVELYATVLDKGGRPVEGLGRADFAVTEDGAPQEVVRFELVRDLPVHAAILFDASASMEGRLSEARAAALRFFEKAVTPKDRAAVVTFSDAPYLTVEFTNQVEALARELASVKAEGGTALWDSVVFTLQYFNGVTGQRAILLLSDGEDQSSRFSFDEVLSYAQSAGVALYAIGLDFEKFADARSKLTNLANATGGRSFFVQDASELETVYAQIERELRSKYLVVYQSSNTSGGNDFRRVELRAGRPGVEVKTIQGYFP